MSDEKSPSLIRVDPATVIIFSILFSPALICGVMLLWKGTQIRDGILLCATYGAAVYWICSPTLELLPGKLIYRALFKKLSVDLEKVGSVEIVSAPAPTLELRETGSGNLLTSFIVKPFSKAGVGAMLQHIRDASPSATFDKVSDDMSQGDFRSVTRQTLSARNLIRLASTVAGSSFAVALAKALSHH